MQVVAGVDEAGRGALGGPVVAAAVILSPSLCPLQFNDSKQLSLKQRNALFRILCDSDSMIGIGIATHRLIGRVNILWATMEAMKKSVRRLPITPHSVLVDGNRVPTGLAMPAEAIIKGDQLEPCISAASIAAKVTRDRIMVRYAQRYPGYGFDRHKGYATTGHYDSILTLGSSPIHRPGFNLSKQLMLS